MANPSERYKKRIQQLREAKRRSTSIRRTIPTPKPKQAVRRNASSVDSKVSKAVGLLTGGLGDFFALESFLSDSMRSLLNVMCYATSKSAAIQSCIRYLPNYKIDKHLVVWSNFIDFWCFFNKQDIQNKLNFRKGRVAPEFYLSQDFSINTIFPKIRNREMTYNGSSFTNHKLTDISHFGLPEKYLTLCPYSSDKRIADRDFQKDDWNDLIKYINQKQIKTIVLNDKNESIPSDPLLINLSNKTSVAEAIELVKGGCGFIGIDSSMSVIASKVFHSSKLAIRSRNQHCYDWKDVYYAPLTDFSFLSRCVNYEGLEL